MIDDGSLSDDSVAALVRAAAPTGFDAGFGDRVLTRLRAEREMPLATALERQFRRVVPLLAAASLVLAVYNWWGAHASAGSAIDAALNLPRVTIASAYTPSSLLESATDEQPEMP